MFRDDKPAILFVLIAALLLIAVVVRMADQWPILKEQILWLIHNTK
jgi:hypothetical protein